MRRYQTAIAGALLIAGLAACGDGDSIKPDAQETEVPKELQSEAATPPTNNSGGAEIGTPMADRVATIGVLNKRNNVSQDLTMKPGESRRLGDVIVRLSACERTPAWEMPKETGAFVQVLRLIKNRPEGGDPRWSRVFSGWLFKNSPSLNVVEDPVYDVWVKDCSMTFPGDDGSAAPAADTGPDAAPAAAPTAAPSVPAAPAPAAPPTNDT